MAYEPSVSPEAALTVKELEPDIIEDIIRRIREWIMAGLPAFAADMVIAPQSGWLRVAFMDPITKTAVTVRDPQVVALVEYETGSFTPPRYDIPDISISIPTVAIPTVPSIPRVLVDRVVRADLRDSTGKAYGEGAQKMVKSLAIPWPLTAIRDWLANTLFYWSGYAIGYVAGSYMNWQWDMMIQPQIDAVTDSINDGLEGARSKVEDAITAFRNSVARSVEDLRGKTQGQVNTSLDEITSKAEAAVNDTIKKVYSELEGLGVGTLMGKAQIQNITESGFDWYAPHSGARLHYVCVGR